MDIEDEKKIKENTKLIVYHAGSLTIPVDKIVEKFNSEHPEIHITREISGSGTLAHRISKHKDKVDIFISADYKVVNTLIPEFASWQICFASNSMVIMYTKNSKYAYEIDEKNWYEVLKKSDIKFGYNNPNSDPCGYRTLLMWKLADQFYKTNHIYNCLTTSSGGRIFPTAKELISALKTNRVDYIFEYESVARQYAKKYPEFKWLEVPEDIDLSKGCEKRDPILYGLTIPQNSQNQKSAVKFLEFFLDYEKGLKILQMEGQPILSKLEPIYCEKLPQNLKDLLMI